MIWFLSKGEFPFCLYLASANVVIFPPVKMEAATFAVSALKNESMFINALILIINTMCFLFGC